MKNVTNPLDEKDVSPGLLIHPLYVFLQSKSQFSNKNYTIVMVNDVIGKHDFYTNHLSKSIPLVISKGAKEWLLYKDISEKKTQQALNEYFENKFTN